VSRRILLLCRAAFLLVSLSACLNPFPRTPLPSRPGQPSQAGSLQAATLAPTDPGFPGVLPTLTHTAVLAPGKDQSQGLLSTQAAPTPYTDPLHFTFPSPAPPPVSAWRPPLYPTPWALSPYDHFYFTRPIAADEVNWPLWDYRYGGIFFEGVIHTGVDIDVDKGTPVLAAGSGKVVWAGYGLYRGMEDPTDPYGLAVAIHHDFGYQGQSLFTVYGHLEQVDVEVGQHVDAGEQLGLSGDTGHVTGPHLHFEVRLGSDGFFTTRNPELWLVPPQGWGVLAGRITESFDKLATGQEVIVHSLSSGQNWIARTYGGGAVNSDAYYRENLVVGDLPAGSYEIRIAYAGYNYVLPMQILPGVVNYFSFQIRKGYSTALPPAPGAEYTPPVEATKTP
jgi:murein DD-endopeptidase MepM/ murein hydrolase activator NlpD